MEKKEFHLIEEENCSSEVLIQSEIEAMKEILTFKSYDQLMLEINFFDEHFQEWSFQKNKSILSFLECQIPNSLSVLEREVLLTRIQFLKNCIVNKKQRS